MQGISTRGLLDVWEQGLEASSVERALGLLSAALPDRAPERLAALPIGQRDDLLLTLREGMFGPELEGVSACPCCGERVELALAVSQFRAPPGGEAPLHLESGEHSVEFRLPTGADLTAALEPGEDGARARLLRRCVLSARRGESVCPAAALPEGTLDELERRMEAADPAADVQLAMTCPACRQDWHVQFDVVSFLWTELESWAARLLDNVHTLAGAYGWSERAILALSPVRRQLYLRMVTA